MVRLWKEKEKQQMLEIKWLCTLSEASGCSGPSKLQWKEARSSSGRMWFPGIQTGIPQKPLLTRGKLNITAR